MVEGEKKLRKKLFFALCALLAFVVTSISFAQTTATTNVAIATTEFATVFAADETTGKYKTDPQLVATGASGTVKAGDLYLVERKTDAAGDIYATLYLSNAAALGENFSYLNFHVQVYGTNDGGATWTAVEDEMLLSLTNGYVQLALTGDYQKYAVSIDDGSFYLLSQTSVPQPQFYIEIR